jgi:uncharacterized protein YbjT (DUF2867 family)
MRIAVAGGTGLVGRYVVEAAGQRGHEVVVVSRSHGVDVLTGQGLEAALDGVDAIIDVTNAGTTDEDAATKFFTEVASQLHMVGAKCGVKQVVTLSIAGIDGVKEGYFAAKLRHEEAALAGLLPATIIRATQFHEFVAQVLGWTRQGTVARVPVTRVQTVAARTAGSVLIEAVGKAPAGLAGELAGPEQANLDDLVRAFVGRRGLDVTVLPDDSPAAMLPPSLLPSPDARVHGPTFATWLDSRDAADLPT